MQNKPDFQRCNHEPIVQRCKRGGIKPDLYRIHCPKCTLTTPDRTSDSWAWTEWQFMCGYSQTPAVHPMCEAMSMASRHGLHVMGIPAAGESPGISPEPAQAHGLTTPATPSAAVGASEPGDGGIDLAADAMYRTQWISGSRCPRCGAQLLTDGERQWCSFVGGENRGVHIKGCRYGLDVPVKFEASSDSKPKNCHNPESEDTPPHNPVMGPVVGTATVKHQTSCPAATAPTVPPEVGKRYVCGNGEVTDAMTLDGGPAYPFMARTGHVLRSWRGDGRHDERKISEYDLIAEYHEPQPAESPDDWVMQDRVPARPGIDERAYLHHRISLGAWDDAGCINWNWMPMHGHETRSGDVVQLRCRRKDLPVVSDKREKTIQVVKDIAEVGILPADKPRMRQVTLREYRYGINGSDRAWTTVEGGSLLYTERTCKSEVPE